MTVSGYRHPTANNLGDDDLPPVFKDSVVGCSAADKHPSALRGSDERPIMLRLKEVS
jgi:hypothetical protein